MSTYDYNLINDSLIHMDYYGDYAEGVENMTVDVNCSYCLNELCLSENDYAIYKSWVSVDTYEMVLITLIVIVFLTGVIGNSLVVIAVTTTKSMQSVTNIFIVNLALADILVMIFCAPPSIIWDVTNTWVFGSLMCRIVIYIQDVSVSVSVLTLTFIAYDRYHAICRPLQFASKRTKAFVVIAAIWSISAMIGIPDAVTLTLVSPFKDLSCKSDDIIFDLSSCRPSWSENFDFFFILMKALFLYILPLIFMSIAYYHIVKTLWRRNNLHGGHEEGAAGGSAPNGVAMKSRRSSMSMRSMTQRKDQSAGIGNGSCGGTGTAGTTTALISSNNSGGGAHAGGSSASSSGNRGLDNQLRTRRKVAKMLIAVVIMFSINFFPVHVLPIVNFIVDHALTRDSPAHEKISQVLMYAGIITHCMCYFNSAINPIIYYFMSAQFKAQYRRISSCRCTGDTRSPKLGVNRTPLEAAASGGHHQGGAGGNVVATTSIGDPRLPRNNSGPTVASRHLRNRSCLKASKSNNARHSNLDNNTNARETGSIGLLTCRNFGRTGESISRIQTNGDGEDLI